MALTGPELEQVATALNKAFTRTELRRVLRVGLDEDFDSLVAEAAYKDQVFELVVWAERQEKIADLVACAHAQNPKNRRLAAVYAIYCGSQPEQTPSIPTPVVPEQPLPSQPLSTESYPVPLRPQTGIEWITIPAGVFTMGTDESIDSDGRVDETPQHSVDLPGYSISKYPITNAQYKEYVKSTGCPAPSHWKSKRIPKGKEDHPVVNVSWHDAAAYCGWASASMGNAIRLPSEAEWEKAARGSDGRIWPWGSDQPPTKDHCNFNRNVGGTTPVNAYPEGASLSGVLDLCGNVWEWTANWYAKEYYSVSPEQCPAGPQSGDYRVVRGGAWFFSESGVRCAFRYSYGPDLRGESVGFRVVRSVF